MTVVEIAPDVDQIALLAGAQFVDAYSITVDSGALDARHAATRMITRQPRWAWAEPSSSQRSGPAGSSPAWLRCGKAATATS